MHNLAKFVGVVGMAAATAAPPKVTLFDDFNQAQYVQVSKGKSKGGTGVAA
eukprot:SAG11_NODE_5889_length_1440_cov_1.217002_1_plen_51_part_00